MNTGFNNINFETFSNMLFSKETIRQIGEELQQTFESLQTSGADFFEKISKASKDAFESLKKSYDDFNSAPSIKDYRNATFGTSFEMESYFDNFKIEDLSAAFKQFNQDVRDWMMPKSSSLYELLPLAFSIYMANKCFKMAIRKNKDNLALSLIKSAVALMGGTFITANLCKGLQEAGVEKEKAYLATLGAIAAPNIVELFNPFQSTKTAKEASVALALA